MSGVLTLMLAMGGAPGVFPASLPNSSNAGSCDVQVQDDGDFRVGDGAGGATTTDWITPSDAVNAAYYQVMFTVTSGTNPSGTLSTWLDCSTTRTWAAGANCNFDLSFREKASGLVRKTYSLSMSV